MIPVGAYAQGAVKSLTFKKCKVIKGQATRLLQFLTELNYIVVNTCESFPSVKRRTKATKQF